MKVTICNLQNVNDYLRLNLLFAVAQTFAFVGMFGCTHHPKEPTQKESQSIGEQARTIFVH